MTSRRRVWAVVLDAVVLVPLAGAVISPVSWRSGPLVNLSAGLGLVATSLLVVVVVLVSRVRALSRALGIELANDLHRRLAAAAIALTLAHAVVAVMAAPQGWDLLDLTGTTGAARAAVGATVALLLIPTVVVPTTRSRRYALRSRLHALVAGIVLVLVGVHVTLLDRLVTDPWVGVPLAALVVLLVVVLLRRWVLRPLSTLDAYRVQGVRRESATASTVVLVPERGRRPPVIDPGQFVWLRLRREVTFSEEHPFTVADSSNPGVLELTVRARGSFTARIRELEPGRRVWLDGPHGAFVPRGIADSRRGLVLIAGGVGITPIISILRAFAAADDPRDLQLVLAERPDERLFAGELTWLADRLALTVTRARHRIDAPLLTEVLPDGSWTGRDYFLCGPPPMIGTALGVLEALGVPHENIHTEQFG